MKKRSVDGMRGVRRASEVVDPISGEPGSESPIIPQRKEGIAGLVKKRIMSWKMPSEEEEEDPPPFAQFLHSTWT
eukprot:8532581-Pyramimonas_sp.AAC.1